MSRLGTLRCLVISVVACAALAYSYPRPAASQGETTSLPARLNAAIQTVEIAMGQRRVQHHHAVFYTTHWHDGEPGPLLAVSPDGFAYLAWSDAGKRFDAHVASLDPRNGKVAEDLFVVKNRRLEDVIAHDNGLALLTSECEWVELTKDNRCYGLYLSRYDLGGKLVFDRQIASQYQYEKEGDQGFDGSTARLAWSGREYAVHLGTNRKFGDGLVHQGAMLALVDDKGNKLEKGWRWGVSHSWKQHVVFDGQQFVAASVGDGHPRGLAVSHAGG